MTDKEPRYPYLGLDSFAELAERVSGNNSLMDLTSDSDLSDPNHHYVGKRVKGVVDELRQAGIASDTIVDALMKEILRFLASNPYTEDVDLEAVKLDMQCIVPSYNKMQVTLQQYFRVLENAGIDVQDAVAERYR